MTTFTLQAPMPEMVIPGGTSIRLEAINPTTGSSVAGVSASAVHIYGYNVSASTTAIEDVIPAYTSPAPGVA